MEQDEIAQIAIESLIKSQRAFIEMTTHAIVTCSLEKNSRFKSFCQASSLREALSVATMILLLP